MHNSYISSSFTIRCSGSPTFSFNDYYTPCLNERFYGHPLSYSSSQCCTCCNCCRGLVENKGGFVYPRYWNGLKQSTLISWKPHKRVNLNGFDRIYGSRYSGYDVGRSCYGDYYERNVSGRRFGLGRRRLGCNVCEEENERHCLCGGREYFDEADVILSLLTEDVGDECFDVGEGRGKTRREIHIDGGGRGGGKNIRSWKKKVENGELESTSRFELETRIIRLKEANLRRGASGREIRKARAEEEGEKAENGVVDSALQFKYGSEAIRSREHKRRIKEDEKRKEDRELSLGREIRKAWVSDEERENQLREQSRARQREGGREYFLGENQREIVKKEENEILSRHEDHLQKVRKGGSSCSSYYSISSGDFESDDEIQVEQDEFGRELQSGFRTESKATNDDRQEYKSHDQYSKESGLVLRKDDSDIRVSGASVAVDSAWRKESEKKLTDLSVKQSESTKESSIRKSMYREDQEISNRIASASQSKLEDRNEKASITVNELTEKEHRQTSETGTRIKHFKDTSETYGTASESSSSSQKLYRTTEESLSKRGSSAQDARKHHVTAGQVSWEGIAETSSRRKAEETKVAEVDLRGTSSNSRRSEIRKKNLDDHSTINLYDAKEKHKQVDQFNRQVESRAKPEHLIEESNSASISLSREEVDRRSRKQEAKSSFIYSKNTESTEYQLEGNAKHVRRTRTATKGSQESAEISVPFLSDTGIPIASSSSQLEESGSLHVKSPHGLLIEEITAVGSTDPSPALNENTLESQYHCQASQQEKVRVPKKDHDGHTLELISPGDSLGSGDHMQKSSEHHIGEFFQKVKSDISNSEIRKVEETHKEKLETQHRQHDQATISSNGSEISASKETDSRSRRSSFSSRSKGPSDEIWHVNEPSAAEHSEEEALVSEGTSQNALFKRSGKSLWHVIADIVHFRWARHENHGASSRTGKRSSPNQSTSSETWFFGHDAEEGIESNAPKDNISLIQGSISDEQPKEETISSIRGQPSLTSSLSDEGKQQEVSVPTSSVDIPKDLSPKAVLLPSGESSLNSGLEATNPKAEGAQSSYPLPSFRMGLSPSVDQILSAEVSVSGLGGQISRPVRTASGDDPSLDAQAKEVKQRKFQRNDQLVKDRFEEWEEAYRLETEQQKVDEMFMREALIEAKKAADFWEVPVGAVLVQHGKIIARGYNLVEELRDSTAHAEMICIREASKLLRSWRLSDATLYVTLEPCPMCAGAILQARIDTVVWGAPNKLLGADGSWIRLFPDSEGASGSDKPAAPVHPFHPKMVIRRGVLASECSDAMQQFFQRRRKKKDKEPETATPPSCLPIANHPSKFLSKIHQAFHILFCL